MDFTNYKSLSPKKRDIFIYIKHIQFEFRLRPLVKGYISVINNYINPLEVNSKLSIPEMKELVRKAMRDVKTCTGNHYHIWLLYVLSLKLEGLRGDNNE